MENEFRISKPVLPPPEEEPPLKITGYWVMEDGKKMLEVEVPHNHTAVLHPNPNCRGHLKLHFIEGEVRGVVAVPCWGCKKIVEVSRSATSSFLGQELCDRRGTRWENQLTQAALPQR